MEGGWEIIRRARYAEGGEFIIVAKQRVDGGITIRHSGNDTELVLNQKATMTLLQLLMKWYPLDAMGQI